MDFADTIKKIYDIGYYFITNIADTIYNFFFTSIGELNLPIIDEFPQIANLSVASMLFGTGFIFFATFAIVKFFVNIIT